MENILSTIFGDKSWTKSLTAWGLLIFVVGKAAVDQACGADLLTTEICGVLNTWVTNIGVVLTALGIRRAANS